MKKMLKQMILAIYFLCIAIVFGSCGKKAELVDCSYPEISLGIIAQQSQPTVFQNLLTGIDDLSREAIGKRPVAVMINNVEAALPQYGVGQADVIFEMPVEGDLTRLMAIYADYTSIPDICAIRSCRYYYPALAQGFDAFYVHWGSDNSIIPYVDSLGITRYDGIRNPHNLFARDMERRNKGYALEHTGIFKGTEFAAVVKTTGVRTELLENKRGTAFRFCGLDTTIIPEGTVCEKAHIDFGAATATFIYDKKEGGYKKQINGHDHVDGKTKEVLQFKNVFVLETDIGIKDSEGHKKIDWSGDGNNVGYYISNGYAEKIKWYKENGQETGYLKFFAEDGQELQINRGKSYIAYTGHERTKFN